MSSSRVPSASDFEARGITLYDQLPPTAGRHSAEVNGVEIGYSLVESVGPRRGTALFVSGYTSSYDTFNCLLTPLAEHGYRVLGLSQRGQPHSSGPDDEDGYRLEQLGHDIHDFVTVAGIDERVHLVGHSFGGVVAQEAVLQDPTRFASVTLWNSGPRAMGEGEVAFEALQRGGAFELWTIDRLRAGADPHATRNVIEQYYFDRLMGTNPHQLIAGAAILRDQVDRTQELGETGLRFLISHGANDDAWPVDWQRDMAHALSADYVVLANAGHSSHGDRPNLAADVLAAFWSDSASATS
jgi:pimeloyl-ACP methyl ester carboxylesterase